jgi:hypothetical protein
MTKEQECRARLLIVAGLAVLSFALVTPTFATDAVDGHRLPQLIGDWMLDEDPAFVGPEDMQYKMTTASLWNYDKDGRKSNCIKGVDDCYKPDLRVVCKKGNQYGLDFVAVCQSCGAESTLPVSVTVDSSRQFNLRGIDQSGGGSAGQGSIIEAPLDAEQVLVLSQAHHSILVAPLGRGPIYVEPSGTAPAFARLAAACKLLKP